jgi:hypothetical protein
MALSPAKPHVLGRVGASACQSERSSDGFCQQAFANNSAHTQSELRIALLPHHPRPRERKLPGRFEIPEQHIGDSRTFRARQPRRHHCVGLIQHIAQNHRPAREQHHVAPAAPVPSSENITCVLAPTARRIADNIVVPPDVTSPLLPCQSMVQTPHWTPPRAAPLEPQSRADTAPPRRRSPEREVTRVAGPLYARRYLCGLPLRQTSIDRCSRADVASRYANDEHSLEAASDPQQGFQLPC